MLLCLYTSLQEVQWGVQGCFGEKAIYGLFWAVFGESNGYNEERRG